MSVIKQYAESLAQLTGTDFELEVCARLQSVIIDFQTVPAKPHGDAGLDGFSHYGERGYCCYGPEHDEFKNTKARKDGIVKKFKSDLRRLCELEFENKKLIHSESPEMATILPDRCKLKHVTLLVNWFEDHRILNPLLSAFNEYKTESQCRYLEADATLVLLGPTELANQYAVDEATILRARQRIFAKQLLQTAQGVAIQDPQGFNEKMAVLREIRPDQLAAIDRLAERFLADWRTALAFEHELNETLPHLHRVLEDDRGRIVTRVSQLMIASSEPWKELAKASDLCREVLERDFGQLCGAVVQDVSSGEIARLIGECPIGWEKPIQNG